MTNSVTVADLIAHLSTLRPDLIVHIPRAVDGRAGETRVSFNAIDLEKDIYIWDNYNTVEIGNLDNL